MTIPNSEKGLNYILDKYVQPEPESGCWYWVDGSVRYGRVWWKGRRRMAHIVIYEEMKCEEVRKPLELDHRCRNIKCVNPEHLEIVTRVENNDRSESPSSQNKKKTHCARGHELNSDNTYFYAYKEKTWRGCRVCKRLTKRLARREGRYK
jgi:hypothetical protein